MLSSHLTILETDPLDPPPPLIGALLRMPWETVRQRMLTGLHARGFDDLVEAHLDVFLYPGPDGRSPGDLAKQAHRSKQALNYLLGQLEKLGYLTRRSDEEDQRFKRIHLTGRGRAVGRAIREIVLEVEAEWEQQLGTREFAQLRHLLSRLSAGQSSAGPDQP